MDRERSDRTHSGSNSSVSYIVINSEQHLKANTRGALRVSSPLPVDILEKQLTNHPLVVTVCVNPAWI